MMRRSGYFDQEGASFDGGTVAERVDGFRQRLWAGTFHSFSSAVIRRYGDDMLTSLRVVSSSEQRAMLSEIVSKILSGRHFQTFTANSGGGDGTGATDPEVAEAIRVAKVRSDAMDDTWTAPGLCKLHFR